MAKGPKYRFPVQKDFQKVAKKLLHLLMSSRWCKREHVECDKL